MKNKLNFRYIFCLLIGFMLIVFGSQKFYAQDAEKNKVRLKADYVKIMDGEVYFNISATSKIDKENVDVAKY